MWRSKVFRNSLNKINAKNPYLAHKLDAHSGILTKEDIPKLIEIDPMFIVVMKFFLDINIHYQKIIGTIL